MEISKDHPNESRQRPLIQNSLYIATQPASIELCRQRFKGGGKMGEIDGGEGKASGCPDRRLSAGGAARSSFEEQHSMGLGEGV